MSINNLPRDVVCADMRTSKPERFSGFTLIELIVTVAIVGILSSIAIPMYAEYIEKAKIVRAVSEIKTISKSIATYNLDNNMYPQSLVEVGHGSLIDPWGVQYQYFNIQTAGKEGMRKNKFVHPINSDYDLYSRGKDRKSKLPLTAHESKDDVIRANDGAYIGLASAF